MEQVAKTAEHEHFLCPFAKIILALAARREKYVPLAEKLLRELCEQYPDNCMPSEYAKGIELAAAGPRFADLCPRRYHPR